MRYSKTAKWDEGALMPIMKRQLGTGGNLVSDPRYSPPPKHLRVGETTYLWPRDADGDNIFHMSADFMNMEVAFRVLGLSGDDVQVVVWDKMPLYSYTDMVSRAFSGGRPLLNRKSFDRLAKAGAPTALVFEHLVFHLESPAANVHERVTLNLADKEPMRCRASSLWRAYQRRVLCSYGLWGAPAPSVPHLTLSIRKRTKAKNIGRVLVNQEELEDVMREGNMLTWQTVNLADMTFAQQLAVMRRTNVYIGVHGAGLMLTMFTAEESILLEIHPNYRRDRHFRNAARLSGKIYMPMRTSTRPTCEGSSDNIKVDKDEFRRVLDDAVRIARSFDDGLSECGLSCPAWILSHDVRLDRFHDYEFTNTKKQFVEPAKFPC